MTQSEPINSKNFYPRAQQFTDRFANKEKTLPTIAPGSAEFNAWRQYFECHLHWIPLVMLEILDGRRKEMTVPTKFPQIFDPGFVENPKWVPPPKKTYDRLSHETLEQLRRRYGPNWGLKIVEHEKRARREWKPPTDEELLERYGRRSASE